MKLPDVGHGLSPPDHGELPLVPVVEGPARPALEVSLDGGGRVLAHLNGDRRDPRERAALLVLERRRVAEHEHLGMSRDGAVGLHERAADPVQRCAQALEQRARGVARGPDHRPGGNGPARRGHVARADVGHHGLGAHLDAEPAQLALGLVAQALGIGGQQSRPALEQHDGRLSRINVPEIPPQGVAADLRHGTGHLDSGGPAAHDHEGEIRVPPHRVGLALGQLEGEQHAAADLERVLQALEPGREHLPLVVPEVRVAGAGRHDQVVVVHSGAVAELHPAGLDVHAGGLGQQHLGVLLVPEDRADGRGDVRRVERRGRHLVEHRLEQVVVAAVHQGHAHGCVAQLLRGVETGESAAQDHHVGRGRRGFSGAHRPIVSRRQRANRITSPAGGTASSSA